MWRSLVAVPALVVVASCASASLGMSAGHAPGAALFAPEIVAARVIDAYQAVVRLRPDFLRRAPVPATAGGGPAEVRVYLDDADLGGIEALHQVPLDAVTQIRYLSPVEADMRWAGSHPGGVILVSTQPSPR